MASVDIFNGEIFNINFSIIDVEVVAPTADFSSTNLGDGTYGFMDQSTNAPTSWLWDFGDGNTNMEQNPEHTYSNSGMYTVCLTASNDAGTDTYCEMMEIQFGAPTANFTSSDLGAGMYSFTDQSTNGVTSWLWDFGDGSMSTEQNPINGYTNSGTYTVCLTATNNDGSDTYCEMIDVVVTSTNDLFNAVNVEVFPNPASHSLHFQWSDQTYQELSLVIVNSTGQTVIKNQVKNNEINTIDIKDLTKGMYVYILKDEKGALKARGSVVKE